MGKSHGTRGSGSFLNADGWNGESHRARRREWAIISTSSRGRESQIRGSGGVFVGAGGRDRESYYNRGSGSSSSGSGGGGTRGNGTLSTVIVALGVAVGILITAAVLSYVLTLHRAHSTSDLAALTAATHATESLDDSYCCTRAEEVAEANGATLTACELVRGPGEVAARVEVVVTIPWKIPGVPEGLSSVSYAGNP